MPHVRAAVSEALYAARMLAPGDSTQSCSVLSGHICTLKEQNRSSWTKGITEQTHNFWSKEDVLSSPILKCVISPTSQESNQLSFSPAASTSTMDSMHIRQVSTPVRNSSGRSKRTPLDPTRGMGFSRSPGCCSPGAVSPSACSADKCEQSSQKCGYYNPSFHCCFGTSNFLPFFLQLIALALFYFRPTCFEIFSL